LAIHSGLLRMQTAGGGEVVDLTEGVRSVVGTSGVQTGVATVFATGSTVAITTMEYEPGGVTDLGELLDRLIPSEPASGGGYAHNALNADTNAHAHLRAALIGPSESIPVVQGELALGTWQQVVLVDFDVRPRRRMVTVNVHS
jgi:secondary thiamine-phosphate synthase enzyme